MAAAGLERLRALKVDGGMVANDWFCQRLADLTGLAVERPKVTETTALGAAYLAGLGAGLFKNDRGYCGAVGAGSPLQAGFIKGGARSSVCRLEGCCFARAVAALYTLADVDTAVMCAGKLAARGRHVGSGHPHRQRAQCRRKPESLARLKQAARKLFVERGYDATRPQDIAREAGLGHGTFYLHYPDKRACFLSFMEDARRELDEHLQRTAPKTRSGTAHRRHFDRNLRLCRQPSRCVARGHGRCGMIDAGGEEARPLLAQWGEEWAEMVRGVAEGQRRCVL